MTLVNEDTSGDEEDEEDEEDACNRLTYGQTALNELLAMRKGAPGQCGRKYGQRFG